MRNSLLLAGLFWAALAQAMPAKPAAVSSALILGQTNKPAAADDEEDDEPKPATSAAPSKPDAAAPKSDAPTVAPSTAPVPGTTDSQQLVSGAPLYNPNVAVHIVEAKQFSDAKKREIVLYPVTVQANGKFTQHLGTALGALWHLHENFALKVWGQYNWYSAESSFNSELVNKLRASAQAATSLLWVWGALGGVEVTPIYGKFAWYESTLGHFSFVVSGGAGFGATRLQLRPADPANDVPASYGQTAPRFLGNLGAGFRLQLGQRFAIRLEVTDVVYTARVDRVNGCDSASLQAMNDADRGNKPLSSIADKLNAGCQTEPFIDPQTGKARDLAFAKKLVDEGSSDVLNNLGFYAGFSVLF